MKNKKYIIITLVIIILAVLTGVIFFFFNRGNKKYPEQPIEQKSLVSTNQEISLNKTSIDNSKEYSLWQVSNSVILEDIEIMLKNLDSGFNLTESSEGIFYQWSNGEDEIFYDIDKNNLIFEFSKGIILDEAEITGNTFTSFVKKHLNQEWQYTVFKNEKGDNGETIYYAKRILANDEEVEVREHYQQTDSLALKDGKIIYGKLLLTQFVETDIVVPLIGEDDLNQYLNLTDYPKEIYPQYSAIRESVLSEVDYLSDEFEKLTDTLSNCRSFSSKVIYLYKSFDQQLLSPVYKLDVECEITYNNQQYSVPAVAYVSAIAPEYLYVPE